MEGQTDILYCHSGDMKLWPVAACAARNYGPRFYDCQKAIRMNRQRNRETERQINRDTERHIDRDIDIHIDRDT